MNYPYRKAPLICLPQYKDSDLNIEFRIDLQEMMEDKIKCRQKTSYELLDIKPGILMNTAVL